MYCKSILSGHDSFIVLLCYLNRLKLNDMKTMIKMAILTFLFKSSLFCQKTAPVSIKDTCSVDLISGINNESISSEIISYIIPGGEFRIEYSFVYNRRVIQILIPVQTLVTPGHDFSCIAN